MHRVSRDCTDQVTSKELVITSKELVIISVELVEKAETLEAYYSIADPASNPDDVFSAEIITTDDDEKA